MNYENLPENLSSIEDTLSSPVSIPISTLKIMNWMGTVEQMVDTLENALDCIYRENGDEDLPNYIKFIDYFPPYGVYKVTFIHPLDTEKILKKIKPGFLIYMPDNTSFEPILWN
jgi:hypothetical protein